VEELRTQLASGRAFSAVAVDAGAPLLDRDLFDLAHRNGTVVLLVDDGRARRDWSALGADRVLAPADVVADLTVALRELCRPVIDVTRLEPARSDVADVTVDAPGRLVAVLGPGGTGSSTVAMALGQASVRPWTRVLLADCARRGSQAVLHHAPDVVPAWPELVHGHRLTDVAVDDVASFVFDVEGRGYHLLLGMRRPGDWAALRRRASEAALDTLTRAYDLVIAEVDGELEGYETCGSTEVEERHHVARHVVGRADAVVLVGSATCTGVHRLAQLAGEVLELGVEAGRIALVVNQAPPRALGRAEVGAALHELAGAAGRKREALPRAAFVPRAEQIERAVRSGAPLPMRPFRDLVARVQTMLAGPAVTVVAEPERIRPGSLGTRLADAG
jgi:hypothetical protein